jgi:hypothetical protein
LKIEIKICRKELVLLQDVKFIYHKARDTYMRESKRPGQTVQMIISCPMTITPGPIDVIEYCRVDNRGYPIFHRIGFAGLKATVIVGHKKNDFSFIPGDQVYTCQFGPRGHLSSVGKELEGQELTVIVHIPEEN